MKKNVLIAVVIIISVIFFNCGEKNNNGNNTNNGIAQTKINYKNGDEYTLKYGLTQGITYIYKISTTSENTHREGNQSQTLKIRTDYMLQLDPAEVDSIGDMDLKVKFISIKMDAEVGGPKFSYDSENPADSLKANMPEFAEYAMLKDAAFSTRVNPKGEIIEVYRLDNLMNKILGENASTIGDDIKMQLKAGVERQIASIIQQLFQLLPSETVKINSNWLKVTSENLDETASTTTVTYKILDIKNIDGKDVAFIEANLSSDIEKRKSVQGEGIRYDYKKPEISGKGEVQFNMENGLVINKKLETDIFTGATVTELYNKKEVTNRAKNNVTVELVK